MKKGEKGKGKAVEEEQTEQTELKVEEMILEQSTSSGSSSSSNSRNRELIQRNLNKLFSPATKTKPIPPAQLNEELASLGTFKEIKLDENFSTSALSFINDNNNENVDSVAEGIVKVTSLREWGGALSAFVPLIGGGVNRAMGRYEGINVVLSTVTNKLIPQMIDKQIKERIKKIEELVKHLENGYEEDLGNKDEEIGGLQSQLAQLEEQLKEKEKTIISLEEELESIVSSPKTQVQTLQGQLKELEEQLTQLAQDKANLTERNNYLEKAIAELEHVIAQQEQQKEESFEWIERTEFKEKA